MNYANGYLVVKVEGSDNCIETIKKFFNKKPIILQLESGDIARLQNIIYGETHIMSGGEDKGIQKTLDLYTDRGFMSIQYSPVDDSWIYAKGVVASTIALNPILPYGTDIANFDYTDNEKLLNFLWSSLVFNGVKRITAIPVGVNQFQESDIYAFDYGKYTYNGKDYAGILAKTGAGNIFYGVNWTEAKPYLVVKMAIDDFTPANDNEE